MPATASPPDVQPRTRELESPAQCSRDDESTVSLCQTSDAVNGELLRAMLIHFEINAAVIQRDPLGMGFAVAELLVFAADHARAAAILDAERSASAPEWHCFNCGEFVPANFDVCWNCCKPAVEK